MKHYTIKQLDNEINTAAPYVARHKERMMIPDKFVLDILAVQKDFNEIYAVYIIKSERTIIITAEFREVRARAESILRKLRQFVNHNIVGYVPTKEDRINTFAPEPKTRTSIGVPQKTPQIDIVKRLVRQLFLQISFGVAPDINHRSLPKGVKGIFIYLAFINYGDPEPQSKDFYFRKEVTNSDSMLQFTEGENEKQVYIKACYVNAKGQEGPMSNAVHASVPN